MFPKQQESVCVEVWEPDKRGSVFSLTLLWVPAAADTVHEQFKEKRININGEQNFINTDWVSQYCFSGWCELFLVILTVVGSSVGSVWQLKLVLDYKPIKDLYAAHFHILNIVSSHSLQAVKLVFNLKFLSKY